MFILFFNRIYAVSVHFKDLLYIGRIGYGIYIRNINMASTLLRILNNLVIYIYVLKDNLIKTPNFGK